MKKKAIHMKFLNHSIGFCLLLTLLCYSCASDYLDTAPTNQVSPADLFKDEAYAAYAVSGLEKLMKTTYPTNKLDGVSFNGEGSVKLSIRGLTCIVPATISIRYSTGLLMPYLPVVTRSICGIITTK